MFRKAARQGLGPSFHAVSASRFASLACFCFAKIMPRPCIGFGILVVQFDRLLEIVERAVALPLTNNTQPRAGMVCRSRLQIHEVGVGSHGFGKLLKPDVNGPARVRCSSAFGLPSVRNRCRGAPAAYRHRPCDSGLGDYYTPFARLVERPLSKRYTSVSLGRSLSASSKACAEA